MECPSSELEVRVNTVNLLTQTALHSPGMCQVLLQNERQQFLVGGLDLWQVEVQRGQGSFVSYGFGQRNSRSHQKLLKAVAWIKTGWKIEIVMKFYYFKLKYSNPAEKREFNHS